MTIMVARTVELTTRRSDGPGGSNSFDSRGRRYQDVLATTNHTSEGES